MVKSGYWLANLEKNHGLIQEASALPSINGLIDQIWELKAPLKIINFFGEPLAMLFQW